MKKVVKFGGSSLASAKQFKKVGDIIRADKSRRYVVPSAPGKRNKNDTKVTDMLYACYEAASTGASYGKLLSAIKERCFFGQECTILVKEDYLGCIDELIAQVMGHDDTV